MTRVERLEAQLERAQAERERIDRMAIENRLRVARLQRKLAEARNESCWMCNRRPHDGLQGK